MTFGGVRAILASVLLMLAMLAPGLAHARAGSVGEPIDTCVRRATPGLDPGALLVRPKGFDCRTPQIEWGRGDFLLLSEPIRTGANWPTRVRSGSLRQDAVTIHALYADGAIRTVSTDARGLSATIQLGAIFEHKLPVRGVPVVRLLWHIEGATNLRGLLLDPRVATPSEAALSNIVLAGLYAAFAGLCAALLIYNLALWCVMRHRFQLDYCVMVVALLVYACSSSGALAWAWPAIDNNARIGINYVSLGASAVAAFAFARSFFGMGVVAGRTGRAVDVASALVIASAVGFAMGGPGAARFFDGASTLSYILLMATVPSILWRAWRERNPYLRLFAITWAAPIVFAGLRVARALHLIPWSFWIDNATLLAMATEALLSTIAIAYRIHLLARDRDRALEDERAARLLAATDPLTGLLNRRSFLGQAIGRSGRQTLLVLDLDHFKGINEALGHDGGDDVLRLVARVLEDAAPSGALVARIGGEEFAIVVDANVDIDPARLLADLRARPMPYDVEVTASIGLCSGLLEREVDWKALYRGADQALFDAKASGRDRVRRAMAIAA